MEQGKEKSGNMICYIHINMNIVFPEAEPEPSIYCYRPLVPEDRLRFMDSS